MDEFDNLSRTCGRLVSKLVTRSRLVLTNRKVAKGSSDIVETRKNFYSSCCCFYLTISFLPKVINSKCISKNLIWKYQILNYDTGK